MCLAECSPALNGPGTKCDASFFPLIVDLKCVWTLDLSFFCLLSFEYQPKLCGATQGSMGLQGYRR